MVEFAIVAPLLFVLVFGIIDFGLAFYTLNNLTSAVREGARYASVQPAATAGQVAGVVTGFANPNLSSVGASQLTAGNITCAPCPPSVTTQAITVSITGYTYTWLTPLPALVGFGRTLTMAPRATFRWERAP
jgi:Flp pilus assembly protein TadG